MPGRLLTPGEPGSFSSPSSSPTLVSPPRRAGGQRRAREALAARRRSTRPTSAPDPASPFASSTPPSLRRDARPRRADGRRLLAPRDPARRPHDYALGGEVDPFAVNPGRTRRPVLSPASSRRRRSRGLARGLSRSSEASPASRASSPSNGTQQLRLPREFRPSLVVHRTHLARRLPRRRAHRRRRRASSTARARAFGFAPSWPALPLPQPRRRRAHRDPNSDTFFIAHDAQLLRRPGRRGSLLAFRGRILFRLEVANLPSSSRAASTRPSRTRTHQTYAGGFGVYF